METVADLLFPDSCVGCRRPARAGICRECLDLTPRLKGVLCGRCGGPSGGYSCRDCRGQRFAFDRARQVYVFSETIRRSIHELKYKAHRSLAESLAWPMARLAAKLGFQSDAAAITWIPSSGRRLKERGFDHARLLAEATAAILGLYCGGLIVKVRDTPAQVRLQPAERRTALNGVFACRLPPPARVIVVDDVFTTGATASEAARALKAAGAKNVTAIALARTLL